MTKEVNNQTLSDIQSQQVDYIVYPKHGDAFFRIGKNNWIKVNEPDSQSEDSLINPEFSSALEGIRQKKLENIER